MTPDEVDNPDGSQISFLKIVFFLAAHLPLAILMKQSSTFAAAHAGVTFMVGVLWAVSSRRPIQHVAYVGAYMAASEVLWRMTKIYNVGLPWEFGKYALISPFILAMMRMGGLKGPAGPLFYFILLLPSAALTIMEMSLGDAREQISFNLSGPLSLFISAWFFSHLKFTSRQRQYLLLAPIGPILGVSILVIYRIVTGPSIRFGTGSNPGLSGGFAPNQVSTILALGALLAFWYFFNGQANKSVRMLMIGLVTLFTAQSILTFSRSGLLTFVLSAAAAALFLIKDPKMRFRLFFGGALLILIMNYVLFPRLDAWTGGTLGRRYVGAGATNATGRDTVVMSDLQVWQENPILGVGPGRGSYFRGFGTHEEVAAHTEPTRMLAEHGLLGFMALLILLGMAKQRIFQAQTSQEKAFTASIISYSLLFTLHTAMRLAVPGFLFGLSFATFLPVKTLEQPVVKHRIRQPQLSSRWHLRHRSVN